jgi:two-component system, sensor histidine kinase and response regulator
VVVNYQLPIANYPQQRNQENPMTPANILLVDDTPANLQLLLPMFSPDAYRTRVAKSGGRALELARAEKPDLILLDIIMPDVSGYDVCRQLKADPETADIPIIFLSALHDIENKLQAFELGGVDYITKPFHAAEVLTRVNTHLTLRRLQEELRRQLLELDAYAHTVAHDLKSPLGVLIGCADILGLGLENIPPAVARNSLDALTRSAYKMNDIIEELLLLATIRQQKEIPAYPLDMWAVVSDVQIRLKTTTPEAESVGIQLENPEKWPACRGYAPWIEEVWVNYLSNALKYGGDPALISVGGEIQGEMARFWVRDRGPGLTAEEQSKLFAPFERLEQTRAQGHGLGLSIVRRIVETLGGQTGVESQAGEGSLFYFTLPR